MAERRSGDPEGSTFTRTSWQDASLFAKRNWLGALVLLLALLSAALTIKLTDDLHTTLGAGCVRGNEQIEAQLDDMLDTRDGNLARARAWHHLIELGGFPTPILKNLHEQERANRHEADDKLANARAIVNARLPVSADPDSPDLIERSQSDCDAIY